MITWTYKNAVPQAVKQAIPQRCHWYRVTHGLRHAADSEGRTPLCFCRSGVKTRTPVVVKHHAAEEEANR